MLQGMSTPEGEKGRMATDWEHVYQTKLMSHLHNRSWNIATGNHDHQGERPSCCQPGATPSRCFEMAEGVRPSQFDTCGIQLGSGMRFVMQETMKLSCTCQSWTHGAWELMPDLTSHFACIDKQEHEGASEGHRTMHRGFRVAWLVFCAGGCNQAHSTLRTCTHKTPWSA